MPRRGVPITEPGHPHRDRFSASANEHAIEDHAPPAPLSPAPNHAIYQANTDVDKPLDISTPT
jgi:hypothetical protein